MRAELISGLHGAGATTNDPSSPTSANDGDHPQREPDQHDRHRRAQRPVLRFEELAHDEAPGHQALRPAEQVGRDVLTHQRDEHQQQPGDDARHRQRQRHAGEGPPAGPRRGPCSPPAARGRGGRAPRTAGRSSAAGSCRRRRSARPRGCRAPAAGSPSSPMSWRKFDAKPLADRMIRQANVRSRKLVQNGTITSPSISPRHRWRDPRREEVRERESDQQAEHRPGHRHPHRRPERRVERVAERRRVVLVDSSSSPIELDDVPIAGL